MIYLCILYLFIIRVLVVLKVKKFISKLSYGLTVFICLRSMSCGIQTSLYPDRRTVGIVN